MNRSQVYVALAAVGLSFILIFATILKRTGMSGFEQLFFRLVFSLLILLATMVYGRKLRLVAKNNAPFFAAIGSTYAFFALSGLSAIAFDTPIAVSVALIYTQPIFTTLISFVTRQEKPAVVNAGIVLLGVLGAFLVSGLDAANPQISPGIAFSVLAGFLYAVYLWLKRRAPKNEYTPLQVLFNTYLFATPILLAAWLLSWNLNADPLLVGALTPDAVQLLLLFSFALFSTVLPYGLLNYVKAEEISPTTEGMLLLADPLLHALWAMLFFSEYISMVQYVGAVLILASAAMNLRLAAKRLG
jgi:drug/metabolite transporter (DMT)-like permease